MNTITGAYCSAIIYNTTHTPLDPYAIHQIQFLCDHPSFENCKVRIMPDVHPGTLSTIGFTSTLGSTVLPNVIGIDIGCGVTMAQIIGRVNEYEKLDKVIRESVPSGFNIHKSPLSKADEIDLSKLSCFQHINASVAYRSLGTLGGGNHFIEVGKDESKNAYLTVHSGSRHLGKEVTEYFLKQGQKQLKEKGINVPYELTYLEGNLMNDYLHDIQIVTDYAQFNRELIIASIRKGMKWKVTDTISCNHNYIDFDMDPPVIRKGAISAKEGEDVIIPINMKEGIIVVTGKGNSEWNCSAPHGAGRICSREEVKNRFTVNQYRKEMKGIYSSCISSSTLDEAPFAYRTLDEITEVLSDTVTINQVIRPVYNYKAGGKE